ncbi:hypothetical protein JKP88DRAFT_304708 [Tribonema minus]|uniref:Uncharacterized protein n=1 Tax=Tribonema minus TaxID=303371 RepID=A0A835ZDN6_9STRA|nr:hypothetical protein JKP88DRAFT_304708 [Tribonema minus]
MADTRDSELSSSSSHENPGPLQGSHTFTACSHEAAEDSQNDQPSLHLCSALEENRQLRITIQQLKDDHRVAVEEQYRRLRELEEENSQQRVVIENQRRALQAEQQQWWWHRLVARDQHSSQQQATTMEVEPQQLDGAQTVRGSEVNAQQRTGIPDEGIAGAGQSSCASLAEDQELQPPTKPGSGVGGGDAHAAAVDEAALEALTAHDAGGNDDHVGDECSDQSSGVDLGIDRVSRGLVKDTCNEREADNDGNARKNNSSYSPSSAFFSCLDSEDSEHVEVTCDESSDADGGSDASSDAWDPDDNNNGRPARKRARITSLANGTARQCAPTASGSWSWHGSSNTKNACKLNSLSGVPLRKGCAVLTKVRQAGLKA